MFLSVRFVKSVFYQSLIIHNYTFMSKLVKIILGVVGFGVILLVVVAVVLSRPSTNSGTSYGLVAKGGMAQVSYDMMDEASPSIAPEYRMMAGNVETSNITSPKVDRLIIKTGELSLVVEDVRVSLKAIADYAEKAGGFVVNSNIRKEGLSPFGEIVVRIPATEFDKGFGDVKNMGEVESETVNGQDVTEEYVDLEAQLKNLRATETQFLQIMQRAVQIEDVLAVQRELSNVRGQIEGIQGRMKYLKESSSLSTLTVYLSTDPSVLPSVDDTEKWKPWAEVKSAARSLVVLAKGLVSLIIWLAVYIPLWIVIGLIVWGMVKLIKRRKNQM